MTKHKHTGQENVLLRIPKNKQKISRF